MPITYFGINVNGGGANTATRGGLTDGTIPVICPGNGAQNVHELAGFFKSGAVGTMSNVRLAIYTTAKAFVMQGAAVLNTSSLSYVWLTHTSFVDVGGNPILNPQLTGGTAYLLCVTTSTDNQTANMAYEGVFPYGMYQSGDYTVTGFPATLNLTNPALLKDFDMRCGVTPVGVLSRIPSIDSIPNIGR